MAKRNRNKVGEYLKEADEIQRVTQQYSEFSGTGVSKFEEFPLSRRTKLGLRLSKYVEPTTIQSESISLALRGLDILGAAKTGSGKTLAFLIPVLECLWRNRWSKLDGLGALIISPTRELSLQTYQVLKKIGKKHDFSAALIIGGTSWEFEKDRISNTNIAICTPGRLLQHMDENPLWNTDNLQILVMDEADRILDLGFEQQMNAIVENLPTERQTLLFSATQTKNVKRLASLSLKDPVYISVDEHAKNVTPDQLKQSYIICEDHNKINLLWSFLKSHRDKKILVFLTSCKQVRFYCEAFKRLKGGMGVSGLYGTMNPLKRLQVYEEFCAKEKGCLIATDLAARGLDFPSVDWVVQLDCPADSEDYIHRSGRTARYTKGGESLLVLTPTQEEPMVRQLAEARVNRIEKIEVSDTKIKDIRKKLEALCAKDAVIKSFAQKCFVSYVRSVYLMRNKEVFNVEKISVVDLALSLGLPFPPRLRFLRKKGVTLSRHSDGNDALCGPCNGRSDTAEASSETSDVSDDEDILKVRSVDVFGVRDGSLANEDITELCNANSIGKKPKSKEALGRKLLKSKARVNKKMVFDAEEGEADDTRESTSSGLREANSLELRVENEEGGGLNIQEAIERMKSVDKEDRVTHKQKLKAKKKELKLKKKIAEAEKKNLRLPAKLHSNQSDNEEEAIFTLSPDGEEEKSDSEPEIGEKRRKMSPGVPTTIREEEELALKLLGT